VKKENGGCKALNLKLKMGLLKIEQPQNRKEVNGMNETVKVGAGVV